MNRRSFFSIAAGAAALATAMRVRPAQAVPAPVVEYDLGGPHAWGAAATYDGHIHVTGCLSDPGHTHPQQLSTMELPTHQHTISFVQDGAHALRAPTNWKWASIERGPVLR